ncbi:TPA: ead/Ea22-like family protein, partial [Klebsiella pneumoniae]|nr:ead/Ea22-like family protein [Klebsiella pneumoniae]HCC6404243.1 ead/Ea22-like family protein [Klebsiella pneumoniae]HCC6468822.1 ead/Ea22-like family protein [Klebsiella pneumoniae]
MTDITELAQRMKAAAIDAKELAIIARYSKGRAAAEKFYTLANPNNV